MAGLIAFLVIFALDLYPGLRGGAGWDWTYERPQVWAAVLILGLLLVVYAVGALRIQAPRRVLMWSFLGAVSISYAVVGVRGEVGFTLFSRTVSPVQTGASALAVRYFAADGTSGGTLPSLRRWTEIMDEAYTLNLIHFTTSPPGQPLIHQLVAELADAPVLMGITQPLSMALRPYQCSDPTVMRYTRGEIVSAGLGLLMPMLAALAVFPLYTAALLLTDNVGAARQAVLWWALVPSVALFAPTWNTVYPALCILSFSLLLYGLMRRRLLWVLLAGVVLSVTTFLNFAVLPVLLIFGVFTM
ncbi:MAG: hypothetical protein H7Y11_00680, partial [Armatimonadetes bacterium]|nr:hypothetical protein [Anaerolineae bacterium]